MGWFDEQIRARKQANQEAFEDSIQAIAGAVMGRRFSEALRSQREITSDAIGEILTYYHVKPQEVPENIEDMNEVLEYLLRPYGIMRRVVKLEKGWYKDACGAMLGTRKDDGSAAALLPHGLRGYRFYDRKAGSWVRLSKKTEGLIDEEAIAFYKPFPLTRLNTGSLLKYIWEQISPSDLLMLTLAMLAGVGLGMLLPWITNRLFSDVLASGSVRMLFGAGIFMTCVSMSRLIFEVIRSLAEARITIKMNISVEAAAIMRVLSLPPDFFKNYSAGELANRVSYMNQLASQLVSVLLSTGLSTVFSLAYLSQIFAYTPALVTPALLMTLLTLSVSIVASILEMGVSRQRMELQSKESGMTYAMISGIQKIRLSGAEERAFARWGKAWSRAAEKEYNPPMFLKIQSVITMGISLCGSIWLYYAAIKSGVSVAEYYAFNTAWGMVSGAFAALSGTAASAAVIGPVLDMVRPFMEAMPEVSEEKTMVTRLSGGIELNNVTFRYQEDMPPILDNLSLKIRPGQYVAIVGRTGCGKSTMLRILLGFETPQKGAVYYDGQSLQKLDLKSLRQHIGTVMQNGKLFMGDIYSNITINAPHLSLDEAWKAAEIAGIAEDIRQMPMGMHTLISEGQGGISGGQRQRILIASAIASKPKILMFDEATSALDNLTQKKVSEALDRMKCTRIVIAHRLSTIRQCDRIIVLDKGRIIEDGNYEELIRKNGFFASLVERQRLDETAYVGITTAY